MRHPSSTLTRAKDAGATERSALNDALEYFRDAP
jgi:hypothetical protein